VIEPTGPDPGCSRGQRWQKTIGTVVPPFSLPPTTTHHLKLWDPEGEAPRDAWSIDTPLFRGQAIVVFMEGRKTGGSSEGLLGCSGLFCETQIPGHLDKISWNELSQILLDDLTDVF
jgi:hypothetical protein